LPDRRHRQLQPARARHRQAPSAPAGARRRCPHLPGQFNWRDVERIKKGFEVPLIREGIATAEDAKIAVEHGVDCVYVSNHGGRQLDQGVVSIDVLPEVVEAVGGKARIIVDGGISRDADVVKALISGADAVGCGRLYVYGLAAAGARGMVRLFEIIEDEIRICLSLLGVSGYHELDKSYIRPARQVVPPHVHSAFPHLNLAHETY
jgi:isopentenyl diphosphate isomerase/L-lactate dehydrogenase-like FMN-dependent dehydrogenase